MRHLLKSRTIHALVDLVRTGGTTIHVWFSVEVRCAPFIQADLDVSRLVLDTAHSLDDFLSVHVSLLEYERLVLISTDHMSTYN